MDRIKCKAIEADAIAALKAVALKHGLTVKTAGGSFSDANTTLKFEFAEIASDGVALTREVNDFKFYATAFGLQPTDFGRQFVSLGRRFTICGLKPGAHKFPILAKRSDGKVFKFDANAVKRYLGVAA